jgi:hypothetical protein
MATIFCNSASDTAMVVLECGKQAGHLTRSFAASTTPLIQSQNLFFWQHHGQNAWNAVFDV